MNNGLIVMLSFALAAAGAQAQDIVVGQSVALSGPDADIGRDMRDGALAVFARANATNALAGHAIKLVTLDNANSRPRAAEEHAAAARGRWARRCCSATTPRPTASTRCPWPPAPTRCSSAPFSNARTTLRSHPNVYTVRASYEDEAKKIIEAKRGVGAEKAVVLYYDDEVGHGNFDTVVEAFASLGAVKPGGVAVKRGAKLDAQVLAALLKDSPHYCARDHAVRQRSPTCCARPRRRARRCRSRRCRSSTPTN